MHISELDKHISRNKGCGTIDTLMKPFTYEKYPGERHAYSLSPSTFGKPMNFMGPHTNLNTRLNENLTPKSDSIPINKSDYNSMVHDIEYKKAKDNYLKNPTPENRKQQLRNVWNADDKFIKEMNNDNEEPMAKVAGKLIQTKKFLEENNLLDTKNFEGFGSKKKKNIDPAIRLRKAYSTQKNTSTNNHRQKGGFVLPAW